MKECPYKESIFLTSLLGQLDNCAVVSCLLLAWLVHDDYDDCTYDDCIYDDCI